MVEFAMICIAYYVLRKGCVVGVYVSPDILLALGSGFTFYVLRTLFSGRSTRYILRSAGSKSLGESADGFAGVFAEVHAAKALTDVRVAVEHLSAIGQQGSAALAQFHPPQDI